MGCAMRSATHPSRRGLQPLLRMRSLFKIPHGEERGEPPRLEPWGILRHSWTNLKLHPRRLLELRARLCHIEEFAMAEAERSGDQNGRELLDPRVVFLHGIVEEAPRRRELVLDVGELGLQLLEILIGLQVRVSLRQREELAQRAAEHILRRRLLRRAV